MRRIRLDSKTKLALLSVVHAVGFSGVLFTLAGQMIISLSNFGTGVLVARSVSPYDFGVYSLLFTSLMMVGGLQNALITGPLRVQGVASEHTNTSRYFAAQVRLQLIFGTALSIGSICFLFAFKSISYYLVLSIGFCLFFILLQEVARTINLTKLMPLSAFVLDCINHFIRLSALSFLLVFHALTLIGAFLSIGLGASIACLVFFSKSRFERLDHASLASVVHKNWLYGRWLLIETLAYTASTQIFLYYVAALLNPQSAGAFNAIQSIFNALNVVLVGVISFAIPFARKKLITVGYSAWRSYLFHIGLLLCMVTAMIIGLIALFAKPLLGIVYGPFYEQYATLVLTFGISHFFRGINAVLSAAFQTADLPMVGSVAKSISALFALSVGYFLVRDWGLPGAVTGMVMTQVIWAAIFCVSLRLLSSSRLVSLKISPGSAP